MDSPLINFICLNKLYLENETKIVNTKLSGIYCIYNLDTNRSYVGSSNNIRIRIKKHFSKLSLNKHYNAYLQRSYNLHKGSFCFFILEECLEKDLLIREDYWINFVGMAYLYNSNPIASKPPSTFGFKHSPEARQKISIAGKGRRHGPVSLETRQKISAAKKGRKITFTLSHRKHLSEAGKNKLKKNRIIYGMNVEQIVIQFLSVKEISNFLSASEPNINRNLNSISNRLSVKGWVFVDPLFTNSLYYEIPNLLHRKYEFYLLNNKRRKTKTIKIIGYLESREHKFYSLKEAHYFTKIRSETISSLCKNSKIHKSGWSFQFI